MERGDISLSYEFNSIYGWHLKKKNGEMGAEVSKATQYGDDALGRPSRNAVDRLNISVKMIFNVVK